MNHFLSCDWGTTSFRIRLASTETGDVLAEGTSTKGIADTHNHWQQSNDPESARIAFYLEVIHRHIKRLEDKTGRLLSGLPVLISGMALSTIGIAEIPYALTPLSVDGTGLQTVTISATDLFKHDSVIISGVRTVDDVMRGEETQLIGCIVGGRYVKDEIFIFPGTHSKHIRVMDNELTGVKTYMTGELFDLLSTQSILKNTVEAGTALSSGSFARGLKDAGDFNLLNAMFKVRTNQLFDILSKTDNYSYLSGLLIGAELSDVANSDTSIINLVCDGKLAGYYQTALLELLPFKKINVVSPEIANAASVLGQIKIARQLKIWA